jgi:hypothetical protein
MTVTLSANAGTGASHTLLGGDNAGNISITTGTGTSSNGILATLTLGSPIYGTNYNVRLIPHDSATSALFASIVFVASDQFTLDVGTVADSTMYSWAYVIF